jgi:hypothetical protein
MQNKTTYFETTTPLKDYVTNQNITKENLQHVTSPPDVISSTYPREQEHVKFPREFSQVASA